jgi:hypothetical protein
MVEPAVTAHVVAQHNANAVAAAKLENRRTPTFLPGETGSAPLSTASDLVHQ